MELLNVELEQESILETLSELTVNVGISDEIKQALLNCFDHVAWIDDQGQTYYDALYDALYPPVDLSYISCVYTQSGTVYDTDTLDSLKSDLVVTAHYSDQSTETITTYTLSGSLTEGTSTITVMYGGKTTSFTVNVTDSPYLAYWDLTQSLVDEIGGNTITIGTTENGTVSQTSAGLVFDGQYKTGATNTHDYKGSAVSDEESLFPLGTIVEIEFGTMTPNFVTNSGTTGSTYHLPNGMIIERPIQIFWRGVSDKFSGWYTGSWRDSYYADNLPPDYFSNKTAHIEMNLDGSATLSVDGTTIASIPAGTITSGYQIVLGRKPANAQVYHDFVVKKVTVLSQ